MVILVSQSTAEKGKFSIKDFFSKCEQIHRKLQIWSHLLEKSLIEDFFFCSVQVQGLEKEKLRWTGTYAVFILSLQ